MEFNGQPQFGSPDQQGQLCQLYQKCQNQCQHLQRPAVGLNFDGEVEANLQNPILEHSLVNKDQIKLPNYPNYLFPPSPEQYLTLMVPPYRNLRDDVMGCQGDGGMSGGWQDVRRITERYLQDDVIIQSQISLGTNSRDTSFALFWSENPSNQEGVTIEKKKFN